MQLKSRNGMAMNGFGLMTIVTALSLLVKEPLTKDTGRRTDVNLISFSTF
jgi:hypothetical protein